LTREGVIYEILFMFQALFYSIAIFGIWFGHRLNSALLRIPTFFVRVNVSVLHAWYRFLIKGDRMAQWEPSVR
jgi:hypothetical protein